MRAIRRPVHERTYVAVALVDCSGCSHSMNPSPASPYGGSTVKVDVDPVRVIVLTRVTSEKLTRRKDQSEPGSSATIRALLSSEDEMETSERYVCV